MNPIVEEIVNFIIENNEFDVDFLVNHFKDAPSDAIIEALETAEEFAF